MKEQIGIEFESEDLKSNVESDIVVLYLKSNAFYSLTDVDRSRDIASWFEKIASEQDIKGVCILNDEGCFGNTAFEVYVASIKDKDLKHAKPKFNWEANKIRSIEIRMLNNFILSVLKSEKIITMGLNGTIVTQFFGASLAADFRFINEQTHFSLSHVNYQLHAAGGLPFFLPKFIGLGKSMEYLLLGGDITANDALQMGLVTNILPKESFFNSCINKTKKLVEFDPGYIKRTKELTKSYSVDYYEYADKEWKYSEHY
jgi:enoyl-CoA hydratase/carnithine racemase